MWVKELRQQLGPDLPIIIVGNKCDLESRRVVSTEQGQELARRYNIQFLETSAKSTVNIDELFLKTTTIFLERIVSGGVAGKKESKALNSSKNIESGEGTPDEKKSSSGCC